MKKFAFLFLAVSLYSQPLYIHHSGTLNAYLIPADTLWREYIIPANTFIPDIMPHIIELMFFVHNYDYELPDSSQWWVDNMEYRTGFIDSFEPDSTTSTISIYEPFGWWTTSSITPDSSTISLNFGYVHPDTGTWDMIVSCMAPEHSIEMQDTVSIWLKAAQMSNLWDYIPLQTGNIWKWNVDDDLGLGNLWTIEHLFAYQSLGAFDRYYSQVWTQSSGGPHHMRLSLKKYEVFRDEKDKVYVNDIPIDFDLLPFENGDNDRYLLSESFQNVFIQQPFDVFNQPPFVKRYADSLLGSESYAYGIGKLHYHDGISATKRLVGAKIENITHSNLNLPYRMGVYFGQDSINTYSNLNLYPPDTNWYSYEIPLWTLFGGLSDTINDTTLESLTISFAPEIFLSEDCCGKLIIDEIAVLREDSVWMLIEDFDHGSIDWQSEIATNGSNLELQLVEVNAAMGDYALEMAFGNSSQWGAFSGWIYQNLLFFTPITFHSDDVLKFKLKNDYPIVGTDDIVNLPKIFSLHQNYPNPFNPVTTIRFELPERTDIRLAIYALRGREVAVLANGVQGPGIGEVRWDAANVASGIYFYRLQTGDQTITRKMVVLK